MSLRHDKGSSHCHHPTSHAKSKDFFLGVGPASSCKQSNESNEAWRAINCLGVRLFTGNEKGFRRVRRKSQDSHIRYQKENYRSECPAESTRKWRAEIIQGPPEASSASPIAFELMTENSSPNATPCTAELDKKSKDTDQLLKATSDKADGKESSNKTAIIAAPVVTDTGPAPATIGTEEDNSEGKSSGTPAQTEDSKQFESSTN